MFSYQVRPRIFRHEPDGKLHLPADCTIRFHFLPEQPFGVTAAIRKQRVTLQQRLLPGDDISKLKAMGAWRNDKLEIVDALDTSGHPFVKHGFLADSDDKGYTWHNERVAPMTPTMKIGLCPSELVQLPDERVVWIYTQKFADDTINATHLRLGKGQGVYARVSADEGATWGARRYCIRLLRRPGYTPYPTSTVLADGTILTVMGPNQRENLPGPNPAMAVRWRPAPK